MGKSTARKVYVLSPGAPSFHQSSILLLLYSSFPVFHHSSIPIFRVLYDVVDLRFGAQLGHPLEHVFSLKGFPNLRFSVSEVPEDQGLFLARLYTGRELSLAQPLLAKIALLNDTPCPRGEFQIGVLDEGPGVSPVEAS